MKAPVSDKAAKLDEIQDFLGQSPRAQVLELLRRIEILEEKLDYPDPRQFPQWRES